MTLATFSHFSSQQLILSLHPLKLDLEIVQQIEKSLGLSFIAQQEDGRVCFANQNNELQDAYKQVFTALDLLDYVYALLSTNQSSNQEIDLQTSGLPDLPYPTEPLLFWKQVKIGQQYRLMQDYN